MKKTFVTILGFCAFFLSCMNPHDSMVTDSTKVIAELTIAPPTFARTAETKDLWLSETKVQMLMDMGSMSGMTMSGTAGRDTVLNSMRISTRIGAGKPLSEYMSGTWMMMQPDSLDHHMTVTLGNAADASDSMRPVPVLYSSVVLVVKAGDFALDSVLCVPVYGKQGLVYGAHLSIPPTMNLYTFEVHATGPIESSRDAANQSRIKSAMDAQFQYMFMGASADPESLGATVLSDSVSVELLARTPQTLWMWDKSAGKPVETAPDSNATVFAAILLKDLKSRCSGEPIGYSTVGCRLLSEDHHDSTMVSPLMPIHGSDGFYFGANMKAPSKDNMSGHTM